MLIHMEFFEIIVNASPVKINLYSYSCIFKRLYSFCQKKKLHLYYQYDSDLC